MPKKALSKKMASKQPTPQSVQVKLPPDLQLQIKKHIQSATQETTSEDAKVLQEPAPIPLKLSKHSYLCFKEYFLKTLKLSDSVVADLTSLELLPGNILATLSFSTVSDEPNDLKLDEFASISIIIPVDMF